MDGFINQSIIEKLPRDHFGKLTKEVLNNLTGGQCCGIYGLPGYGRDFFAKHIALLIERDYPDVKVIFLNLKLDSDKVSIVNRELSKWMGVNQIDEISLSKYLASHKIVVILTEVHHPNHARIFRFLTGLRTLNQKNFTVLTVANYSLFKNPQKYLKNSDSIFVPLRTIEPFDLDGVRRIMEINNEEYNWNIPLSLAKRILFLSGGNPSLVKHICMALYEEGLELLDHIDELLTVQPLNFRVSKIAQLTTELTIEEQLKIGLINHNGTLFSCLPVEYLKTEELTGLELLFPNLTKTDRKILSLLIQNPNKIIDKDQLSLILEQTADTYSEWAIYKAVARLRDKVRGKYTIQTLKGQGWRMESRR